MPKSDTFLHSPGTESMVLLGVSRREFLTASLVSVTSLALAGCGGGSKSNVSGSGAALSAAQRSAVLTSIGSKYEALPHQSMDADNALMLAYLATVPQLRSVQLTTSGTIAARFTDGPGYVFLNNLDDSHDTGRNALRASSALARAASQIPESGNVFLLNGLGVVLGAGNPLNQFVNSIRAQAHIDRLDQMFQLRGYQRTKSAASIAALRSVKEAGVFYFIGHGGLGIDEKDQPIYIINTTDASDTTTVDDKLAADIKANYVGYTTFAGTDGAGKRRAKAAYYITPAFVANYLSFSKYSVAFINGCVSASSATPNPTVPDPKFEQAFFAAQVSTYIGWDDKVNASDVRDSAEFFFDRLLGANLSDAPGVKQSPPARPFDYMPIVSEMQTVNQAGQSFNLTQSLDQDPPGPGETRKTANLVIAPNPKDQDTFALLTPSIENIVVGGNTSAPFLLIRGAFGNDPQANGSVTLYPSGASGVGNPLTVLDWQPTQIRCALPASGGDIVVTKFQHTSNPRRLTEWKGALTYQGSGPGNHSETFTMNLHILADIQPHRSELIPPLTGSGALLQAAAFNTLPDASCSYTNTGDLTGKVSDYHWFGGSALPPGGFGVLPGFHYEGVLDPVAKTLKLYFSVQAAKGVTVDTKDADGNIVSSATGSLSILTSKFPNHTDNPAAGKIAFTLGDNLEILALSISDSVDYQSDNGPVTLSTSLSSSVIPVAPGTQPDPNAARSLRRV